MKFLINWKSRGFLASGLSTYDFSTLYTTLLHNLIKEKLTELIEQTFNREDTLYLASNEIVLMEMFLVPLSIVHIFFSLFVLLECVLMLMTSTTEIYFQLLSYKNKVIDIIKFEKHFLNSTADTQS